MASPPRNTGSAPSDGGSVGRLEVPVQEAAGAHFRLRACFPFPRAAYCDGRGWGTVHLSVCDLRESLIWPEETLPVEMDQVRWIIRAPNLCLVRNVLKIAGHHCAIWESSHKNQSSAVVILE